MARLLVIGDTHFQPHRVAEGEALSSACIRTARERQPDAIVCLGDTLHTHGVVHVQAHNLACTFLRGLLAVAPTFLLIGNHDLVTPREFLSDRHVFNPLKKWTGLTVVDRPLWRVIKGTRVGFCPFVPVGRFAEALDHLLSPSGSFHWAVDLDVIFAHQEFRDARIHSDVRSTTGDVWSPAFPPVVSGHLHQAHDLSAVNVFYPGTPVQHTFAEKLPKHIWMTDFSRVPFSRDLIDLGLKRKVVRWLDLGTWDGGQEAASSLLEPSEDDVKLVVTGTLGMISTFRRSSVFPELRKHGVVMHFRPSATDEKSTAGRPAARGFLSCLEELVREADDQTQAAYAEIKPLLT